jgi:hypothetical protein
MDSPHTLPHLTTSRSQNGVHHSHPDSTMIQTYFDIFWHSLTTYHNISRQPDGGPAIILWLDLLSRQVVSCLDHWYTICMQSRVTPGARVGGLCRCQENQKTSKNLYRYSVSQHFTTIGPDKCLLPIGNARHTPLHAHDWTGAWTSRVVDEWLVWPHGM